MITNIIEAIRNKFGYPALKKVDPNSQEIKDANNMTADQKMAQAAIPAVLAAMLKYSDSEDGVNLLSGEEHANWLHTVYCGKEDEAVRKVAEYTGVETPIVEKQMSDISAEAVHIIRENVKSPDAEKLRTFMNSQRHSILSHLPAAMKMGDVLGEDTFDDRTNKMEGPVSSFLHRIEDII